MEGVDMEASILPFLPVLHKTASGALQWAPELAVALQSLATGRHHVHGGEPLCAFINDLRAKSHITHLSPDVSRGFTAYFNEFIIQEISQSFFENVLPFLADLALRFPLLLNEHFKRAKGSLRPVHLRVLKQQEPGLVYMSQELVAAILTCAFFCLYPIQGRKEASLPHFKFEGLFEKVSTTASQQQHKVHCILHYFTRLSQAMPQGIISFERKVLLTDAQEGSCSASGFDEHYWSISSSPLCSIQVMKDGLIEDQSSNALEVDFANRFLGGGVLRKGCVQEEIRFVISPELIAGMLFMPAMQDNESIEIRGVERFSHYTGYSSSFRFAGNYSDTKPRDSQERRKTCIIAINALRRPGEQQFKVAFMLRETNKAFCGFREHLEPNFRGPPSQVLTTIGEVPRVNVQDHVQTGRTNDLDNLSMHGNKHQAVSGCHESEIITEQLNHVQLTSGPPTDAVSTSHSECTMGIATGNWGCGAYGGDVELKSMMQWIAASQAGRPFLHYFTFGSPHGQALQEVADLIINKGRLVGDVWKLLIEYGQQRLMKKKHKGLFEWILPRL